jgi:hypothetical protein
MERKVCFIIPIHPPHYKYLKFLKKLDSNHLFSIIFVLTIINDKIKLIENLVSNAYSTFSNIRYITLEEDANVAHLIPGFNNRESGIINIKKIYGLNYLIQNYDNFDYIAMIDSEIEFIDVDNLYNRFKSICDSKVAIAGNTTIRNDNHSFLDNIHNESMKYIQINDRDIINKTTNNGKYYFWYSDIPVYHRENLSDFLNYIGFNNFTKFIEKMNFWCFDYVIYYYYCIAFQDYKILCMEDYNIERHWSLETATYEVYKQVQEQMNYKPSIVIYNTYYKNKELFVKDEYLPVYIYHLNNGRYNKIYEKKVDYLDN